MNKVSNKSRQARKMDGKINREIVILEKKHSMTQIKNGDKPMPLG